MENRDIIRIGTIRAVDAKNRKVRVWYDDLGIVSGWLPVVQVYGAKVDISTDEGHSHKASIAFSLPSIDARVLVIYLPVFNADGFVLGGL